MNLNPIAIGETIRTGSAEERVKTLVQVAEALGIVFYGENGSCVYAEAGYGKYYEHRF